MVGIASLALGAVELAAGLAQNANRETPEQYQETAEMKSARARGRQMAQGGFTPAEKAAFKQSLAATGNTAYRRGVDLAGGNLAGALRAGINAQQLNAQNQFSGQDAQLMRQNISQSNALEQGYQGLKNAQTDQQRQVAAQQAQAAQQSINSGLGNLGSALNLQQALNYQPNMGGGSNAPMQVNYGSNNNPNAFNYNFVNPNQNQGLGNNGFGWTDEYGVFHNF